MENQSEDIMQQVYASFGVLAPEQRAAAQAAAQAQPEQQPWIPIDLYAHRQRKQLENSRKEFPKGSRSAVKAIAKSMIDGSGDGGGLVLAKKKAENDSESLKAQGYDDRAELVKEQYMAEKFIPAIEAIINYSSPDELLNCREALSALDSLAIGTGSMKGYTAAYVRQAYGEMLGQKRGDSDAVVSAELNRIKSLVANDQIRTAIGAAQRLKQKIDNGEGIASPEDYAIIGRVVAYAN